MTASIPASQHFTLHELAGGVFAAVATELGFAISNAGIVDLGDRTLVFDAFLTPVAAQDLRQAAERLTGRPVSHVIYSHYHNDHIRGAQVFLPQAEIISTARTRSLVQTAGLDELCWDQENALTRLAAMKSELAAATTSEERRQAAIWAAYFQAISESLPDLQTQLPNLTFESEMVINGTARQARLVALGRGHTEDDAVLYLPGEGIAFLSDLLFTGFHPYLADGDPTAWVDCLRRIARLDLHTFIPGHGRVGERSDLRLMIDYIETLQDMAAQVVASGGTADQAAALPIPQAFASWQFPRFFAANMRFLWNMLAQNT